MEEEDEDSIWFVIINILCGVVLLFFAVMIFHLYFRCWLFRRLLRRNHAEDMSSGHHRSTAASEISSGGLDPSAITSLPTFLYDPKNQGPRLECAVCISEFQPNEAGRVLPECGHHFHVDCIDMWLQSHRDCPLCRARVKVQPGTNRAETSENSLRGPRAVMGPAQREGFPMGLSSFSATTLNAGPIERVVSSTGPRAVMGRAQNEECLMGLSISAATLDAGPMGQHLTKIVEDPDTDGSVGPDLELGSSPPNYGALH